MSLAVHVGLWNDVDWMVSVVFFHFSFFVLTPVTKLIGIVRAEVSVAPNVELMGKTETDFIERDETNDHEMRRCFQLL